MEFENKRAEKNKNLVKSPRTILTIYYKYFCGTDNMAQINQINQLIDQALELDDSVVAMISMLKAIFWKMIMTPIISLIFPSSLKSTMIFEVILSAIGKLIWNQVIQQSDQAEQLYNQAIHLRSLPSLDGDQNR